jgi:hypothetical protein
MNKAEIEKENIKLYIKNRIRRLKTNKPKLNFAEWMTNIDRIEELKLIRKEVSRNE